MSRPLRRVPFLLPVAAALALSACGSSDSSAEEASSHASGGEVHADVAETQPGDPAACMLYATDGQAVQAAYDAYGSGANDDPTSLGIALDLLARDVDQLAQADLTPAVYDAALEASTKAGDASLALADGGGLEEIDATLGELGSLDDLCAAINMP